MAQLEIDWQEVQDAVWNFGVEHGPSLIRAVLVFVVGRFVAKIVRGVIRKVMRRGKVDETLVGFIGNIVYTVLLIVVVLAALGELGVQTTSFVAILGAAGLAIGFALQGSLANFAAGVMLILFRPFKAGDYIEGGGTAGTVKEVQMFATVLNTPDNKRIIVPNSALTGDNITNYSVNDTRRVDMKFGCGYDDDILKAKQLLEQIVTSHDKVLKDPAPVVAVAELGDSSVNFHVRPWVKTPDYWSVYFDVQERVKTEFDAQGLNIPFPQRDVHIHQVA